MGYHVIDPDDIDHSEGRPCEMHYISKAAGMEEMGLRLYRVAPGEEIPVSGLHYHDEQEEAFYVPSGELRVETPDEEFVVPENNFFVAEPGSVHRAFNPESNDATAVVVGMGAPPLSDGHAYEG